MTLNDNISKLLFKDQASVEKNRKTQQSIGGALNGLNSDPLTSSQKLYEQISKFSNLDQSADKIN